MSGSPKIQWARLAALKPLPRAALSAAAAPAAAREASPPASGDSLARLLGGERVGNHYGEFLRVQRWFSEPAEFTPVPRALEILAPGAPPAAADPSQWMFLDTETTGLAGGTGTYAFLVGMAWWESGGLRVEQLFMRDFDQEHSLLLELAGRLADRRVLVTFNGKTFDWPLLETRFRMTRQIEPRLPVAHLDLLHPARQVWRMRLGSVRLAELEREVLGFDRGPDLWSQMIPQLYFDYLRGGEEAAPPLADVFRHNQMDLRGLATLAARMMDLCAHPERTEADPLDLYGISRLLRNRGDRTRARQLYERSLEAGLPTALDRAARRELAALAKRDGDLPRAVDLWQQLSAGAGAGGASASEPEDLFALEALEQLALYYERRVRQPERAAGLAREALAALRVGARTTHPPGMRATRLAERLEKRLRRLERPKGGSPGRPGIPCPQNCLPGHEKTRYGAVWQARTGDK